MKQLAGAAWIEIAGPVGRSENEIGDLNAQRQRGDLSNIHDLLQAIASAPFTGR